MQYLIFLSNDKYIYTYSVLCNYIQAYKLACTQKYIIICMCIHTYMRIRICMYMLHIMCICTYAKCLHMCVCVYICVLVHTHVHTYMYTCICTCLYVQLPSKFTLSTYSCSSQLCTHKYYYFVCTQCSHCSVHSLCSPTYQWSLAIAELSTNMVM